jgi:hypothetical protein
MKQLIFYFVLFTNATLFSQSYNFLGPYTSDGTPLYFAPSDVVTNATKTLIQNSLPENYPVPTYNPHYISSGYQTDIFIDSLADVWVTFVLEGASFKNVLGFYTYDINNPPTTAPTASQITIVFPNVSSFGGGGSLVSGNKVKIGTFPAGTGIGWVLLANAWNGSSVTNGAWRLFSNPNFNPETNPALRHHNVLLNDPNNNRVFLGYEDVRRDVSYGDSDFNDAIFYITASSYSAMRTSNLADISSATNVSSANNGGLESKGDLATLIAKRNFNRVKNNSFADTKAKQAPFKVSNSYSRTRLTNNFSSLIPNTGMFGTETTFVSSPTDLVGITNALEVYSVDYYQGTTRVAAVLGTATNNGIYGHSKAICDRLNNSTLEDIRTIQLNGYEIIMAKIKRANGAIEFALNFSVQQLTNENKLHSYWNINQYPSGDYLNFQVWGSSMGQVCSITNYILGQFQSQMPLNEDVVTNRIPSIFVKKGFYKNGQLNLKLANKSNASSIVFSGNKKGTETAIAVNDTQNITLSTALEQDIVIATGGLFDIGFTIQENNASTSDVIYLADGPWGLDYSKTESTISKFEISNPSLIVADDQYAIERNTKVEGMVYGTMNLFRNILPGELALDATNFSKIGFAIQNSLAVEVVLVTENMTNWNNRLRIQLPANATNADVSIALADFKNAAGQSYSNEKIKGCVFSTIGNYASFQPFAIGVSNLRLSNAKTLSITDNEITVTTTLYNYPNPCTAATTLVLPKTTETANVKIIDLNGRIIANNNYNAIDANNEIPLGLENIKKGVYMLLVTTKENETFQTKLIVR